MNIPSQTHLSLKNEGLDWQFWLLWVVVNAVGIIIGLIVFTYLSKITTHNIVWFVGVIIGSTVGIAQWFILHRKISVPSKWVLASIFGAGVGWLGAIGVFTIGAIITYLSLLVIFTNYTRYNLQYGAATKSSFIVPELAPTLALCGATIGIFVGLSQWFVLRRQIQHAKWWIWINTACFSFAGLLSSSIVYVNDDIYIFFRGKTLEIIDGLSVLSGLSIIGLLLIWLLQSSIHRLKISLMLITVVIILGVCLPFSLVVIEVIRVN